MTTQPAMPKDIVLENGKVYVSDGKGFDKAVYDYAEKAGSPLLWFTTIHPHDLLGILGIRNVPVKFNHITKHPDHEEKDNEKEKFTCINPVKIEIMTASVREFSEKCKNEKTDGIVHFAYGAVDRIASENGEKYVTTMISHAYGLANKYRSNCVTLNIDPLAFSTIEYRLMSRSNDFIPLSQKD